MILEDLETLCKITNAEDQERLGFVQDIVIKLQVAEENETEDELNHLESNPRLLVGLLLTLSDWIDMNVLNRQKVNPNAETEKAH